MSKKWSAEQLDKNFEAFLKESISDSDITESGKNGKKNKTKSSILDKLGQSPSPPSSGRSSENRQWWLREDDDEDEFKLGESTKSFLKTEEILKFQDEKTISTPETQNNEQAKVSTNSMQSSVQSQPGMETIQEEQEKEIFFQKYEANEKGENSVDYSRLNQELGNSSTVLKNGDQKKLLANVSLMTTNGTLQTSKESKEHKRVTGKESPSLISKQINDTAAAEMEELQKMLKEAGMSTFGNNSSNDLGNLNNSTAFSSSEIDLKNINSVTKKSEIFSSTPSNTSKIQSARTFTTKTTSNNVMYGFELSPVHSTDVTKKEIAEPQGFDLSPVHSHEIKQTVGNAKTLDDSETTDLVQMEKLFDENVADKKSAPNFMQAKVASPRHTKTSSTKPGLNEETETMMSQVYSSQDGSITSTAHANKNYLKHPKKKQSDNNKKMYSSYQHGKLPHTPNRPYAYVPSSGYGVVSPIVGRPESVKIRKKSPTRRSPSKNKSKKPDAEQKTNNENKTPPGKRKTFGGKTFVLAPTMLLNKDSQDKDHYSINKGKKSKKTLLQNPKYSYENEDEILETVRSLAHLLHDKDELLVSNTPENKKEQDKDEKTFTNEDMLENSLVPADKDNTSDWKSKFKYEHDAGLELKEDLLKANSTISNLKVEVQNNEIEIEDLKKDKFVLQSKLNYILSKSKELSHKLIKDDSLSQNNDKTLLEKEENIALKNIEKKKNRDMVNDNILQNQIESLKKHVAEQEDLIKGYQQENEKAYEQLKTAVKSKKETEVAMYEENRQLKSELANFKESLKNKALEKVNKNNFKHNLELELEYDKNKENIAEANKRISQLEFQLQTEAGLHNKTKLQLTRVKQQCSELEKQLSSNTVGHDNCIDTIEEKYKKEISTLKSRLKWYAENQDMLDQDQEKLRNQQNEIENLHEQVKKMQKLVKMTSSTTKNRDQIRIQDLERQVKELEKIVQNHKNPNSVQALVFAANQETEENPSKPLSYWEGRAKKLEQKLENRDKETAVTVRALQQQYNNMKLQYENQIENLESQIRSIARNSGINNKEIYNDNVKDGEIKNLKKEISKEKSNVIRITDNFEKQIEYLQLCLAESKNNKSPKKITPSKSNPRIKELESQCQYKNVEIDNLKMKIATLKEQVEMHELKEKQINKRKRNMKPQKQVLPEYDPNQFKGDHFTEVHKTNTDLQLMLGEAKLELEKEKVLKQGIIATAEQDMRVAKENFESEISRLKQALSEQRSSIGASPTEEENTEVQMLKNQVEILENQISVMQEHVNAMKHENKDIEILRKREQALQIQIKQLLDKRHMEKLQSPNSHNRNVAQLECKIKVLEEKQKIKDHELRLALIGNTDEITKIEIRKLEQLVKNKNLQISKFRAELDSIILVLRELQAQGVVIHANKQISSLIK